MRWLSAVLQHQLITLVDATRRARSHRLSTRRAYHGSPSCQDPCVPIRVAVCARCDLHAYSAVAWTTAGQPRLLHVVTQYTLPRSRFACIVRRVWMAFV
ncbi:hypothetical protein C8R45DRAFT_1004779, partial [Mycena sanguinolenta]